VWSSIAKTSHCSNDPAWRSNNCGVTWGANPPDYFTHALQAESVTGLKLSRFSGKAAHPGRDEDIIS